MSRVEIRSPFNSALEAGLRAVAVLTPLHPRPIDLQTMVELDYLMIHSGDANGPESLHPPLPLRSGELLVRRGVLERGVLLMVSKSVIARYCTAAGFGFAATELAQPLLDALSSPYLLALRARAEWVAEMFGFMASDDLSRVTNNFYQRWSTHFEVSEQGVL